MIGLDTNILVRLVTQDDAAQARVANNIVERKLTPEEPGFVSIAAVLESVWVLRSVYRTPDAAVADALLDMLSKEGLQIESEDEVLVAALALKERGTPFEDTLIAALGRKAGCSTTLTFDKRAARLPGFQLAT